MPTSAAKLPLGLHYLDGDYYAYPDVLPPMKRDDPTPVTMIFRKPRPGEIDLKITHMRPPKERPDDESEESMEGDEGDGDSSEKGGEH